MCLEITQRVEFGACVPVTSVHQARTTEETVRWRMGIQVMDQATHGVAQILEVWAEHAEWAIGISGSR